MEWELVAKAVFGFMALAISGWVARSIDKMRTSVEELNVKIAVVITQVEAHEKRLSKLEDNK